MGKINEMGLGMHPMNYASKLAKLATDVVFSVGIDNPEGAESYLGALETTVTELRKSIRGAVAKPEEPKAYRIYMSGRGLPLLYTGVPTKPTGAVLTLENYCKWYGAQIVYPDGTVENVDPVYIDEVAKLFPKALYGDHGYTPEFLYRLAKHLRVELDPVAVDVAGARWLQEQSSNADAAFFQTPK